MRRPGSVLEGFAGPGGLSRGAELLGITDVLGIEINADACATARAAGHRRKQCDIRALDPDDFPHVQGWLAASPCPTYASSGKRSGIDDYQVVLDGIEAHGRCLRVPNAERRAELSPETYEKVSDPRTALVLETLEFAICLPNLRWMVFEQVPAVEFIWQNIAAELAAHHRFESVNVVLLRASDFGVATIRTRALLIACKDYTPDLSDLPHRGWWEGGRFDAITEHPPNTAGRFPQISMAKALGWPAGVRINTRGNRTTPGGNVFSADGPAVSMTGNGTRSWYRTDLGDPAGRLTAAQAGLLQGFPVDYPWQGSRSSQFQRVADTVSPLVGAAAIGAATGLPWRDVVEQQTRELYGPKQLDLFAERAA